MVQVVLTLEQAQAGVQVQVVFHQVTAVLDQVVGKILIINTI